MGYRAIALSQVDGADGELVGRDLARKLGFGYLNEAIVAQVAKDQGVDTAVVAEAERRKSFFTRVAEMAARGAVDVPPDPSLYIFDQTDTLLSLIRDAVYDAAGRGSVVLVAHAACYACADRPEVLRVCITAPLSARASRVASALGISEKEAARSHGRSDARLIRAGVRNACLPVLLPGGSCSWTEARAALVAERDHVPVRRSRTGATLREPVPLGSGVARRTSCSVSTRRACRKDCRHCSG